VLFKGQTTVSDALCRFQNANDAPLPDAQNVTEGRKSCEVPSFPQNTLLVVRAPAGRSLPAPGSFCKRGRKSQTALAHSVSHFSFAVRPSNQPGAKDRGEQRQAAGAGAERLRDLPAPGDEF
jgi:hypothetical protein